MNPIGDPFHGLVDFEQLRRREIQTEESHSGSKRKSRALFSIGDLPEALPARTVGPEECRSREKQSPSSNVSSHTALSKQSNSPTVIRDSARSVSFSQVAPLVSMRSTRARLSTADSRLQKGNQCFTDERLSIKESADRPFASGRQASPQHTGHAQGGLQDRTVPYPSTGVDGNFFYTRPGPISDIDRQRYRRLEVEHSDLFSSREIQYMATARGLGIGKVKDVDLSESDVINATTGEYTSIGTKALSTCIAVCARGRNARGEDILGLNHYDGLSDTEQVLSGLDSRMKEHGSVHNSYYLVGGMILPVESEIGSYDAEAGLLALRRRYDIRGAKLHVLEGEYDSNGGENMLNVVVTPKDIYFSRKDLYKSDQS